MTVSTINLVRGRYRARLAEGPTDRQACFSLRGRCFETSVPDTDPFDDRCTHLMLEDLQSFSLVGCCRVLVLADGRGIDACYSAQFYDLSALAVRPGPMVELGRFCVDPVRRDPDILRLAWAALTRLVDGQGADLLFGCASFRGVDPQTYQQAFAWLHQNHLAPLDLRPGVRAAQVHRLETSATGLVDPRLAMAQMPPLLRSYLAMGGWVSDHAVIDDQMRTLHVFTAVETRAIPEARKRQLRAIAG